MTTKIWMFPGINMKATTFDPLKGFLQQNEMLSETVCVFPPSGKVTFDYPAEADRDERWICIGHSAGSLEAVNVALRYPEKVKGLITISMNLQPYSVMQLLMMRFLARRDLKIHGGLSPFERSSKEELLPYYETVAVQPSKMLEIEAFRREIRGRVQEVSQPWLYLYGDKDLVSIQKSAKHVELHNQQAQIKQMPHVGHYLPVEDPNGLARQVRAFLGKLTSSIES